MNIEGLISWYCVMADVIDAMGVYTDIVTFRLAQLGEKVVLATNRVRLMLNLA